MTKKLEYSYVNYKPFSDIGLSAVTLYITLTIGNIFFQNQNLIQDVIAIKHGIN